MPLEALDTPAERLRAGTTAKGDYACASCGYGIAAFRRLPICPMCHGTEWLAQPWSPFTARVSPVYAPNSARAISNAP
jgi:hypothetical protein